MGVVAGDLVWVPFGPRTLQGVVFELPDVPQTELDKIRPITARTVDGPFISEHLLRVAHWVAGHYRTSLFTACSLMLPPGASSRLRTWLTSDKAPGSTSGGAGGQKIAISPREQQAIDHVRKNGRIHKSRVSRSLGLGGTAIVDRLIRRGVLLAESEWEKPRVSAVFTKKIELTAPPDDVERLIEIHSAKPARPTKTTKSRPREYRRVELLKWFQSGHTAASKKTLNEQFGTAAVKWAFGENLLTTRKIRRDRDPLADYFFQQEFAHSPTEQQKVAIGLIVDQIQAARPPGDLNTPGDLDRLGEPSERKFLLHGVTGSGKTEVYLQAIEACLAVGKRAIYLVPEIALTPQTLQRIAARFPGQVAVLHSGLTVGQRYDQWWRVRNGDFPIVLGSRGAIFAPVKDIGLIVIDEEHEWTYKQGDKAPRYHARAAAERISIETGATLVLGSATPDIASYRAAKSGRYRLLELPERVGRETAVGSKPTMPDVQIVDMRAERADGHFEMLSRTLIDSMRDALADGGQVILFINRRGTASFVQCVECGNVRQCRRCDTALTFHRDVAQENPNIKRRRTSPSQKGMLVCHYCNYTVGAGRACPTCDGKQMHRSSPGTQMVARTVGEYFPGIEVIRWDSDSARTVTDHQRIMDEFVSGSAKVLVGTQMVAKGLDIPSVTLVGVISAETGLAVPNFRAAERAFQVLAQVVGRTGRGAWGGHAVIQAFNPDHYAIQAAADHDYTLFYETEIRLRASQANPPFTSMVRLTHAAGDAVVARAEAERLADELSAARENHGETSTLVIGPTPAYPLKVRNQYRWHILLKGSDPARLLDIVPAGPLWSIDVDPG